MSEFAEALRDLGYVEGQDIRIEVRSAAGKTELLRGLADELVRLKADVIVTRLMPPLLAAKDATQTMRTAKALGLTVPQALLVRADEVIE